MSEPLSAIIHVRVAPSAKPAIPPPEVRLRAWLKIGKRAFGINAAWAPSHTGTTQTHDPDAGRVEVAQKVNPAPACGGDAVNEISLYKPVNSTCYQPANSDGDLIGAWLEEHPEWRGKVKHGDGGRILLTTASRASFARWMKRRGGNRATNPHDPHPSGGRCVRGDGHQQS